MTSRNLFWSTFGFLFLFTALGFSQTKGSGALGTTATKTLVDSLARQINKYYVFKDAALKMSNYLKLRCAQGAYHQIKDPYLLAGMLTEDARSVHKDEHFYVEYNPAIANEISGNVEDVPKMVADKLNQEKAKNFGFKKAEILGGNIGYLEISSFSRLNDYSKEAARQALSFLMNSRAIIIDLRYGMGGSPEMVNYLLGFFVREKTHVMDIQLRSENATLNYMVLPDSTLKKLKDIPLYVLISYKTFSAAEGLAYELQSMKRAVIIGETSRGGAHTVTYRPLSSGFVADIPFGRALSPITKSNWEGVGVIPDEKVKNKEALEYTRLKIVTAALEKSSDSLEFRQLKWQKMVVSSLLMPLVKDTNEYKRLVGTYGANTISFTEGELFYQKQGKARFELEAIGDGYYKVKGNESFLVHFDGEKGLITYYEDGRVEVSEKQKK